PSLQRASRARGPRSHLSEGRRIPLLMGREPLHEDARSERATQTKSCRPLQPAFRSPRSRQACIDRLLLWSPGQGAANARLVLAKRGLLIGKSRLRLRITPEGVTQAQGGTAQEQSCNPRVATRSIENSRCNRVCPRQPPACAHPRLP